MTIRPSASKEIRGLVADLSAEQSVTREAAIARLTVIGARASDSLAALIADATAARVARVAALRIFEASGDPGGLDAAIALLNDSDVEIVIAAVAALRPHLRGPRGALAVDRLTGIGLDRTRAIEVREPAVRALLTLEKSSVRPLVTALRGDPSPVIAELAGGDQSRSEGPKLEPGRLLSDTAAGRMPGDADAVRRAIAERGDDLPLPTLLSIVERIREQERAVPVRERSQWLSARAAAHVVLARRGSRIALYDLREAIQRAREPLPAGFLAALGEIGDVSCVEAIAAAYSATKAPGDWWRAQLAETFRRIVRRQRITRRHAAVKRIERRSPKAFQELWPS